MRILYAFLGAGLGALTNITINLLSAAIQQRALDDQFTTPAIIWLIGVTLVGLILGIWLGTEITIPPPGKPAEQPTKRSRATKPVTMTRFMAILSYGKLRGRGIHLLDILLIGSKLDIDTRE